MGRSGRGQGASGPATVELVLILPVVFAIIMLAIQVGMWAHAAHVVTAAAQEGALSAVKRKCRVAYTWTCRSRRVMLTPGAHLPS